MSKIMENTQTRNDKKDYRVLLKTLGPLKILMVLCGVIPYSYKIASNRYFFKWKSTRAIHSIIVETWFLAQIITSLIGLFTFDFTYSNYPSLESLDEEQKDYIRFRHHNLTIEYMIVMIIIGCLINASIQLFSFILHAKTICQYMNIMQDYAFRCGDQPNSKIRALTLIYAFLICGFAICLFTTMVSGFPLVIITAFDFLSEILFLIPFKTFIGPYFNKLVSIYFCVFL